MHQEAGEQPLCSLRPDAAHAAGWGWLVWGGDGQTATGRERCRQELGREELSWVMRTKDCRL